MNSVLLVDDEPRALDGLRRALRSKPWRVTYVTSAAARDHSEVEPADVVVSDFRMPGIDGGPPAQATGRRRL